MGTVFRADMRAHTADIDDAAAVFPQRRQTSMHAAEGAVEDDVHHLAPVDETHVGNMFLTSQCGVVHENIDAPEFLQRCIGERNCGLVVSHVAKKGDCLPTGLLDLADDTVGLGLVRSYIYDD